MLAEAQISNICQKRCARRMHLGIEFGLGREAMRADNKGMQRILEVRQEFLGEVSLTHHRLSK